MDDACPHCGCELRQETDNGVFLMVCDDCPYAEDFEENL